MVKKQEAEYRKKGMEQKKTFQDQLSRKVVRKQPVRQEPKVPREDQDQFSSEEYSDGGTETPSEDSEEESEDTHHRLKSVLREKAPDSRYNKAEEQKQSVNQQDPGYADDLIMKRYMSDADDKQSLPYGPDHWSSDAVTPTRQNDGNNCPRDQHHQHSRRQSDQATRNNKGSERQFRPQWQEPPKPTRVSNAPRYQHQGWRSTLPQGNRARNVDQQSAMGSSYSGDSGQGGHRPHHHHGHQRNNQRNQGNRRGRHFGNGFQGRHLHRERDNSDEGSHHGRGHHQGYGHHHNRERDYGDQGYRGYQRKNPKLSNYDGKISFRAYEVKLNRMAQQYQWTEDEKLSKFVEALQDRALEFYGNLPEEVRDDYQLVSKKFRARFWPQEPSQTVRSQLKVLKQQPEESLEEYAEKCQQLATDAWGATNPEMTEHSAMDAFLHGLIDTEAAYSTLDKEPANLDEALELTKRAMHNRRALLGNRSKNVRMVSFAEEEEKEEKKIRIVRTDGAASNPVEERISKMEESMAETKKQLEQILKLMQTQNQNPSKSYANPNQNKGYANSPRRPGTPIRCYRCHELGHGFRECKSPRSCSPSPGPQQGEATQEKQQLND